jgi:hypothetical protein
MGRFPGRDDPWWRGVCSSKYGQRDFVIRAPDVAFISYHLENKGYDLESLEEAPDYHPPDGAIWFFRSIPQSKEFVL